MKTFIRAFLLTLLCHLSLLSNEYMYEISPYYGKNLTDKNYRMGDSPVLGLNFDTFFHPNFGVRFGAERLLSLPVEEENRDATMNRFYINGVARQKLPQYGITPYIFGGFGHESCEDNDCPSAWFKDIGLGLGIDLSCNFKVAPEVKMVNRDRNCGSECGDGLTDVVATFGATYAFGAPKIVKENIKVITVVTKEVPVEVPVEVCHIPKDYKDRCDNNYYIQVASMQICPTCKPKIRDGALLKKLKMHHYDHELYPTTLKNGDRVGKVLIGPYRCKKDAYAQTCKIKKELGCDVFIYSK